MNRMIKATYLEYQFSLFGAMGIALGLGILLNFLPNLAGYLILIVGSILHAFGMFKIHSRNFQRSH